jgi:hypothetical protein
MIIKRFVSLFRTTGFKIIAFFALLATSVLIALAMLLGNEAGQFVIRVRDDSLEKSIALTTDLDAEQYLPILNAEGMTGMADYSAQYFIKLGYNDLDEITATTGQYKREGNSLYAYTFYIVNTTPDGSNVGVNVEMTYSKVTKNLDKAIRIMTYAYSTNTSIPEIYQAKEADGTEIDYVKDYGYVIEPQLFEQENVSDGTVFNNQHYTIGTTASESATRINYMKYSVFFWIEGNDPECDEKIMGGTIKFDLTVSVAM